MTNQPDALRLLIEDLTLNHEYCPKEIILDAAAELRRLHEVNQELMKALKNIASTSSLPTNHHVAAARWALTEIAKTAIAKATGESNA